MIAERIDCPYIIRKCADCLDRCQMTDNVCELELCCDCEYWDDEKKEEREPILPR